MFPLHDTIPRRHRPIMVLGLIGLNAVVYLVELMLGPQLEGFFYVFGIVPARFSHPDWALSIGLPAHAYWSLLTSMFLHAGWLHIIGNMWFLWLFGDNVEDRMGPARFLTFYLVCGLAAGTLHCLTNADSTIPTVGASGAIAGVLGAYMVLFPASRILIVIPIFFWPFFFELPAVYFLAIWLLIQFFWGTLALAGPEHVGGVAFWAHVGGFAAGVVLHRFFLRAQERSPAVDRVDTETS